MAYASTLSPRPGGQLNGFRHSAHSQAVPHGMKKCGHCQVCPSVRYLLRRTSTRGCPSRALISCRVLASPASPASPEGHDDIGSPDGDRRRRPPPLIPCSPRDDPIASRSASTTQEIKDAVEFSADASRGDGLRGWCKACEAEARSKRYKKRKAASDSGHVKRRYEPLASHHRCLEVAIVLSNTAWLLLLWLISDAIQTARHALVNICAATALMPVKCRKLVPSMRRASDTGYRGHDGSLPYSLQTSSQLYDHNGIGMVETAERIRQDLLQVWVQATHFYVNMGLAVKTLPIRRHIVITTALLLAGITAQT